MTNVHEYAKPYCITLSAAVVKLFRGKVGTLLRHPTGQKVLDDLYFKASSAERNTLAAEVYMREFGLFGATVGGIEVCASSWERRE